MSEKTLTLKEANKILSLRQFEESVVYAVLQEYYKTALFSEGIAQFGLPSDPDLVLGHENGALSVLSCKNPNEIPALRELLEEKLSIPLEEKIGQFVMFNTAKPVDGFFRYGDRFQIFPVPRKAPRLRPGQPGKHPCLLQFKYQFSPVFMVDTARRQRKAMEIVLSLSVLTKGTFEINLDNLHAEWVRVDMFSERLRFGFVKWLWRTLDYNFHGNQLIVPTFSHADGIKPIELIDEIEFYNSHSPHGELVLPTSLSRDLNVITRLSPPNAKKLEIACLWARKSNEVWRTSRALSFIAAVTAIEALIDRHGDDRKCECCGRSFNPGATKQFKAFMEAHLGPSAVSKKFIDEIYRVRSLLAHGNMIMDSDMENISTTKEKMKNESNLFALRDVVNGIIRGWLATTE